MKYINKYTSVFVEGKTLGNNLTNIYAHIMLKLSMMHILFWCDAYFTYIKPFNNCTAKLSAYS